MHISIHVKQNFHFEMLKIIFYAQFKDLTFLLAQRCVFPWNEVTYVSTAVCTYNYLLENAGKCQYLFFL